MWVRMYTGVWNFCSNFSPKYRPLISQGDILCLNRTALHYCTAMISCVKISSTSHSFCSQLNRYPSAWEETVGRVYPVHTLYTIHCIIYTVHCTLYTLHCTLYTVHCTLYTVYCTLYTHYGQTKIKPMRLDTKGFWIDSFLCMQDKIFFFYKKHLNILRGFYRVTAPNKHYKIEILTVTASSATL